MIESGQAGQTMFATELQNKLHAADLSIRIDNFSEDLVRKLSADIVELEATRLGLRRHGTEILEHIIKFVHEFLWKSSNDSHEAILKRKRRKNKRRDGKLNGLVDSDSDSSDSEEEMLNIVEDTDSDDDDDDDDIDDDESNDSGEESESERKHDDSDDDEQLDEDDENEVEEDVEQTTVQIHEIYATLWANEKIILQSVDVLSALKQSPTQLEMLNRSWTNNQNLPQSLGPIMTQLLDELEESLKRASAQALQERVGQLLSTSKSFTDLFNFLDSLQYNEETVKQMREKWNIIRLAMICVSACPERIGGDFITDLTNRFRDHRFDDLGKLGTLVQLMADALPQNADRDEALQWFCQNYIRFFAFSAQDISQQFTQSLIQVIAEEKKQRNTDLNLIPNAFTKFEMASQILKKSETNDVVKGILSYEVEKRGLNSVIACLFSRASEQRLHHDMRSNYMSNSIAAPKLREVEAVANKLNESIDGTKLDQVLAISECKVVLTYFIRYLQSVLGAPKSDIDEKGIWYNKRIVKKANYLSVIGQIFKLEKLEPLKDTKIRMKKGNKGWIYGYLYVIDGVLMFFDQKGKAMTYFRESMDKMVDHTKHHGYIAKIGKFKVAKLNKKEVHGMQYVFYVENTSNRKKRHCIQAKNASDVGAWCIALESAITARTAQNQNLRFVKWGLQCFFVSELWIGNRIQKEKRIAMMAKAVFRRVMHLELCIDDTLIDETASDSMMMSRWEKRFGEQVDLNSPDGREFAREYLPNIFLPFRLLTLSMFKEKFLERFKENKQRYPVTWGILHTIDSAAGYSVFALKHLPAMITWMKLLKQRLNQRLNLDDVLADPDLYSSQWVMDKCMTEGWGDIRVWTEAFNGFVKGWNHLAERVTTQEEMEDVPIHTVMKGAAIHHPDPNHDDQKKDGTKMIRKNHFKKFIKIPNVYEALPIKPFVSKSAKRNAKTAKVKPVDVPLVFGMDSGQDGKLDTSIMIRKIVQHYVSVNNRVIGECYQLGDHDDEATLSTKRALGLDPGLDSSYISRSKDVVDIDEEELREIIQQCFQQKLRYGDDIPDAVNWRLLESRLRERYITGRKFIFENPIYIEFEGQFNIPTVLQKIDRQHAMVLQADPEKEKFFEEAPPNLLAIVKLHLRQRAVVSQDNIGDDYEHDDFVQVGGMEEHRRNRQLKQRLLEAYSDAQNAAEQTLVALQRQKNLPEKGFSLGTYMKDNLHLYPKEHDPFIRTQLQLKHLGSVWRFLERIHLIEEGIWHEIPKTTMELYKNPINDELKTGIMQFITMHDMNALWTFLSAFRRFLETMCRKQLSRKPDQESLVQFLSYAEDVDEELVYNFPPGIKLNQAGFAYFHAAKEYQKRNDREASTFEVYENKHEDSSNDTDSDESETDQDTVCKLVFRQINRFLSHNSSHFSRGDKSVRQGQNPNRF